MSFGAKKYVGIHQRAVRLECMVQFAGRPIHIPSCRHILIHERFTVGGTLNLQEPIGRSTYSSNHDFF